jgi:hypothetical protein
MKAFSEFRITSRRLSEGMTKAMPAERGMASDLEEPEAVQMDEDEIEEDAPTNTAGGGAVAAIGVGPQGEPGVSRKRTRNQAIVVGPPVVDPRMFQAKIFARKPPEL